MCVLCVCIVCVCVSVCVSMTGLKLVCVCVLRDSFKQCSVLFFLSDKTIAMWKWRDEQRQWRLYDQEMTDKLEAEHRKRPNASCVVFRAGRK